MEHLNVLDADAPNFPTPADAGRFVTAVGHDGVRRLYDAYHAARAGLDPVAQIGRSPS